MLVAPEAHLDPARIRIPALCNSWLSGKPISWCWCRRLTASDRRPDVCKKLNITSNTKVTSVLTRVVLE